MNSHKMFTSFHEAGHALACFRLGVRIAWIWISEDGRRGAVWPEPCEDRQQLIISQAGFIGEAFRPKHCPKPTPLPPSLEPAPIGPSDGEKVAMIISDAAPEPDYELEDWSFGQAASLIQDYPEVLGSLARFLSHRLDTPGDEVEAMLTAAGVTPFVPRPYTPATGATK